MRRDPLVSRATVGGSGAEGKCHVNQPRQRCAWWPCYSRVYSMFTPVYPCRYLGLAHSGRIIGERLPASARSPPLQDRFVSRLGMGAPALDREWRTSDYTGWLGEYARRRGPVAVALRYTRAAEGERL